jgi:hypothetical protein
MSVNLDELAAMTLLSCHELEPAVAVPVDVSIHKLPSSGRRGQDVRASGSPAVGSP